MCQAKIAELEMMTVGFSVSSDGNHFAAVDCKGQPVNKLTAGRQNLFKGYRTRGRTVVKKDRDRSMGTVAVKAQVRNACVEDLLIDRLPCLLIANPVVTDLSANARGLVRRQ